MAYGKPERSPNKSKRRKAWIPWKSDYSLSLVHLDWLDGKFTDRDVYGLLDDSLQHILPGSESDAEK